MELTATIGQQRYAVKLAQPHDLSIAIRFDGAQLSVFGSPPATAQAMEAGAFVGDVARGGSCNCAIYHLCPHTNGTHTECVGHITAAPIHITDILDGSLFAATLVTITPTALKDSGERYDALSAPDDLVITRAALAQALQGIAPEFLAALVIRTLPNDDSKRTCAYEHAPYCTHAAIAFLLQHNVQHLLIDTPSLDRLEDGGKLLNHRLFWNVSPGEIATTHPSRRTVTELIYVNPAVADGNYMLNLGIAPMAADAAPSRPLLYEITRL